MNTEVTFPEVTLWCSGVHLQDRTSIMAYLHLYIGRDRGFPDRIERGQSPTFGVASSPKWEIIHPRMSGNPHSTRMTGTGPAFVSICNSKRVIPPPSVTDRDITQRHQLTSHSVTVRTVSSSSCYRSRYYRPTLGIVSICNYKEGFQPTRVTDRDKPEAWWESNPLTCRHK